MLFSRYRLTLKLLQLHLCSSSSCYCISSSRSPASLTPIAVRRALPSRIKRHAASLELTFEAAASAWLPRGCRCLPIYGCHGSAVQVNSAVVRLSPSNVLSLFGQPREAAEGDENDRYAPGRQRLEETARASISCSS